MTSRQPRDTIMAAAIAAAGRAAAVVLCAWLLAACGGLSLGSDAPDQGEAAPAEAAPEQQAEAPPPESAEASPVGEAVESEAQVSTAVPIQPPEPEIDDDPEQLMGMGTASLSAFLGAPELIRRESPASIWQYRAEGCVLDIVLYPESGKDQVSYIEAREDGLTRMPPRACLNRLLRARYEASAG